MMALQCNLFLLVSICCTIFTSSQLFVNAQHVPCYFVFGDSIMDNGNNNNLKSLAKANYYPYGVDFPHGATGRFTNGRNPADFIGEYLGFKQFITSHANANTAGKAILQGVNYASGSAGIREETGQHLGDRIFLGRQLQNHQGIVSQIGTLLGRNATDHLRKCVYVINIGSNDFINNYFVTQHYNISNWMTPMEYATSLTQQYSQHLKTLYNLGARKIAVFGVSLLGCMPMQQLRIKDNLALGCNNGINMASQLYTNMLPPLLHSLNSKLTDARFTFINYTHISLTPVPGQIYRSTPCCVVNAGQCKRDIPPCLNRGAHTFFDKYHPSEHTYELEAKRAYNAPFPLDATPYGIKALAQLQL